jgi:3D (Asp-Asp-Asp) domain-containing protein
MIWYLKQPVLGQKILIILISAVLFTGVLPLFKAKTHQIEAEKVILSLNNVPGLVISQGNSLFPLSNPNNPEPKVAWKLMVVATAYSSTVWQTDDTPYITAAGTSVRDGIIANNILAFGTRVRIPELYGDKIFVVEDRMSWKKGNHQIDIWFPEYWQAKNFGAKTTLIEILES